MLRQLRLANASVRNIFLSLQVKILGPLGADSDLRRWGLRLAERGGKSGKKPVTGCNGACYAS
jgi:hypothetical protein